MKKWLVMTLLASLFVVTACGGSNGGGNTAAPTSEASAEPTASAGAGGETAELEPEEGASLVVWDSKSERAYLEEMTKKFTEQYGIPVKIEEVEGPDQVKKLTTDGPAGLGADVVSFAHDNLGTAVPAGLLLPNDFFEEQTRKENSEVAVNAVSYDGTLYGYPRSVETYTLIYNKALVKEAPKSFDDVVAFAKTYNDPAANKYAIMWELGNFYYNYMFIASNGGYVYGDNGQNAEDIGLNNDAAVQGMTYFASLKESLLPMNSGDITYDIKKGLFTSGSLAMDINGPWTIGEYKNAGLDIGVAPLPTINGNSTVSFSGVKAWYVNAYSKYPKAARLLANFLGSKESQLLDFKMTGAIPANKEAANDPAIQNDEATKGFLAQFNNSQSMPTAPEMGNVWTPIGAAFADVWNDGKDPKAALDNAVQQIKDANGGTAAK
ncbi:extracellular solute-binding protein [Paenibacillus thailandensis]|uniref:Maltodextrin-binding protein n=1 Tax=Paenibacillus thailandensis TaxID=393250 RepID=A0ABW5R316_9BACL